MAVAFLLSMSLKIASVVWIKEVSVECHFLFPFCLVESLFFSTKYGISLFRATLSHIFDKIGNSEIDLLLFACSWSPSLGIGDTSAIFQTLGKVSQSKSNGILSIPGALFEGPCFLTVTK